MLKKIASFVIAAMVMSVLAVGVLAAPDVVYPSQESTTYGLFNLKNPNVSYVTTLKTSYTISGTSPEGTYVALYKYSPGEGLYRKFYMYGGSLETRIGASGLYIQQVDLNEGDNRFLIRAEKSGEVQFVKFNINYLGQAFLDKIKGMSTGTFNGEVE